MAAYLKASDLINGFLPTKFQTACSCDLFRSFSFYKKEKGFSENYRLITAIWNTADSI